MVNSKEPVELDQLSQEKFRMETPSNKPHLREIIIV